jgi:hypothetical protein
LATVTLWCLRPAFAILALLALMDGLTPAIGATVTCVRTEEITDGSWESPFIKRLRDQGFAKPDHPICASAMLTGEIKPGDAHAVETMVRKNLPFLGLLALNSPGGSVDEAIRIGRAARRYYLKTAAPSIWDGQRKLIVSGEITDAPDAICASACFFAWLGGPTRMGEAIAIHRPFPPAAEMRTLSPAEADRLYHDLSNKILIYLSEMDAAPHWLSDMMKIPSDDLHMIPEGQVHEELEGDARTMFDIPSLAQWKLSKCGGISIDEWNDMHSLLQQQINGMLPKKMEGYRDYLYSRLDKITKCGDEAVKEARWQLHGADLESVP